MSCNHGIEAKAKEMYNRRMIKEVRISSIGRRSCAIFVTLPKGYMIIKRCSECNDKWRAWGAKFEECKRLFPDSTDVPVSPDSVCKHRYLNGSQILTDIDCRTDLLICSFIIDTTNDILDVLHLVPESVQWVSKNMVEHQ